MGFDRLHLFVRQADGFPLPMPPPGTVEDEMLDIEDVGLIYESPAAALSNRAALLQYLTDRASLGIYLAMGGPRNPAHLRREPGEVYIDLAAGTIPVSLGGGVGHPSFELVGPSKLIGINAATITTPVLDIIRDVSGTPRLALRRFEIESDGSGIRLEKMGTLAHLENLTVKATGSTPNDATDPLSVISHDDFDDLLLAVYGLFMSDCDGTNLVSCQIKECVGHGVMCDRWHAGSVSQTQSWSNSGAGWKLSFFNGVAAQLRGESNLGWGVHMENSGSVTHGAMAGGGSDVKGTMSAIEVWNENNNRRDTQIATTGHPFRQMKLGTGCGSLTIGGHSGWRSNMVDVPRGVRRVNKLIEGNWVDPSEIAAQDMKTMVSGDIPDFSLSDASHNWDTQWTNPIERPSVIMVNEGMDDQRLDITLPANCLAGSIASGDFWQPMSAVPVSVVEGDVLRFSAKISIDAAGVALTTGNEAQSPRQSGLLFDISIDPFSGANLSGASMWDTDTKLFDGMVFVDQSRSNINLAIRFVVSDAAQRFVGNQPSPIIFKIHEFFLYTVLESAP